MHEALRVDREAVGLAVGQQPCRPGAGDGGGGRLEGIAKQLRQQLEARDVALDLAPERRRRGRGRALLAARGLQLVARALAELAERGESEPAGKTHHGRGADPGALRERFRGVEGELVQMLAHEREDALVVARQPAAGLRDAHVELVAEAEAQRVRVLAHRPSMSELPA